MAEEAAPESTIWRDGFPFLGNQLSLDFLNTAPTVNGQTVELLDSNASLLRWLLAAELLSPTDAKQVKRDWETAGEAGLVAVREFREQLREAVFLLEARQPLPAKVIERWNSLLRRYPRLERVAYEGDRLTRHPHYQFASPADVIAPLLYDAIDLFATADPSRVRKCDSCPAHFHDRSKKGTRRWCAMQLCGNRVKVAAYQKRRKQHPDQ